MTYEQERILRYVHKEPKTVTWLCHKLRISREKLLQFISADMVKINYILIEYADPEQSLVAITDEGLKLYKDDKKSEAFHAVLRLLPVIAFVIFVIVRLLMGESFATMFTP